jgi:hypothetical protein
MGTRWGGVIAIALTSAIGTARADGVCVTIDTSRDTLTPGEQSAVRIAVIDALAREGVAASEGPCTATVTAYNIRLGKRVTTTISSGDRTVSGQASSIDELDLLVRQLVRSLVTGRAFATGTGVQDRENVLRDQTSPVRSDPSTRRWDQVFAFGGGMLQLPARSGRPLHRQYNIVSIDARLWGLSGTRSAFEMRARILLHDYDVFESAHDAFEVEDDDDVATWGDLGRASGLVFSPFAVANWEFGLGYVRMLGDRTPHPYVRIGAGATALCRFSDPEFRFDIGLGAYGGIGFQISDSFGVSVEANFSRPIFHGFADSGYTYFFSTTANLEFRRRAERTDNLFRSEPIPTIRRINE